MELHCADCMTIMSRMADNSVNLVVTDPPYFRVKSEKWDNAWGSVADYFAWYHEILAEIWRVLKPNGSLYLFAGDRLATRTEMEVANFFNVLNRIVWVKYGNNEGENDFGQWNRMNKESLRSFFPQKEEIIFAEHHGSDNHTKGIAGYNKKCDELKAFVFEPLRKYFQSEREKCGISGSEIQKGMYELTGKRYVFERHTFITSQWELPTQEQYEAARAVFNAHSAGQFLRREYEGLRREYEGLRREYEGLCREYEGLRRPFNVNKAGPFTDIWRFQTVHASRKFHSCQKPVAIIDHILACSSREGDTVLDPFMGSGTTGIAGNDRGLNFIGIEKEKRYFDVASRRIKAEQTRHRQLALFENF